MDPLFEKNLMTTKDAGELFGYSSDYLARLARSGKIEGKRIGHSWFINKESLTHFLDQQGIHKVDYARALSREREIEYRKHHSFIRNTGKALSKQISLPAINLKENVLFSQFVALSVSFFVVASGAYIAYAAPFAQLATNSNKIARETAFGFNEAFGNIPLRIASRITDAKIEMNAVVPRVATRNRVASADLASAILIKPDLSSLHMSVPEDHSYVTTHFRNESSPSSVASIQPTTSSIRNFSEVMYSLITNPVRIADSLAAASRDTFKSAPEFINQMNLAFGNAIITATQSAIRADILFAYRTAEVAPESARVTVAFVVGVGDAIANTTARVAVRAPATLAQSVFDVEYAGASRFVALTESVTQSYLGLIQNMGHFVYSGTTNTLSFARSVSPYLVEVPAIFEDTYLGALGKTAAAWEGLTSSSGMLAAVAPALSIGEHLALSTYTTINNLFSSATRVLAFLFASPPSVVTPVVIQRIAVSTSTPIGSTSLTTNRISYSYPTYTTVVQGVSEDFLNQSLASLRLQSRGSTENASDNAARSILALFNKGIVITEGTSIEATTGSFTNLTGGTTNLSATTITGNLTVSGIITPSLISATSYISAPYFIATSSSATSTFAGSLAIGTSTPFGNGLFIVGTSTPLLYISGTNGRIGIGTSSPSVSFDLFATDSLRLPVGTTAQRPGGDVGYVRYNTTTHQFEGYGDNSVWQGLGGVINPAQTTYITAGTDDFLRFVTASTERMTITDGGFVGIGTTSPYSLLSISNNLNTAANTPLFTVASTTAGTATSTLMTILASGRIGIGTAAPDASAVFDVTSTTGGILPPRLTTVQKNAIPSPTAGLTLYDSTLNKLNVYNGSAWKNVGSTEIGGEVTNGVLGSILFIGDGTILGQDNANFNYSTSTGRLGIGTSSPFASLSIAGLAGGNTNIFAISTSTSLLATTTALTVNQNGDLSLLNGANLSVNGNLTITGTTAYTGLTTFTNGFLSNASSTITSGLFTMSGGASTTNITASGTGYFNTASTTNLTVSSLTANRVPYITTAGVFVDSANLAFNGTTLTFPFASTTQFSAYSSLVIGGTSTTTLKGDGNTSTIYGPLTVNGIPSTASILNIQRGTGSTGNTMLSFNDSNADPMLQIYTDANTGYGRIVSYQTALTLGTSIGGTALSITNVSPSNVNATANIIPTSNEEYDLGSPAAYWDNGYVRNIVANNLSSASTSIAGTNNSSFSIDSINPTADARDISLVFYRGASAPSNGVLSWNSSLKRFEFNQNLHLSNAATSPASTTLAIAAVSGQTGALTNWLDSSGNVLSTVTSDGSLGIGTTNPLYKLEVNGTASSTSLVLGNALGVAYGGTGLTSGYNNTNWDTAYTNRITSASFPLSFSANVLSFNGLSTSTEAVVGNIPYFSSVNTFANVATSTPTLGLGLSYAGGTLGSFVGGTAGTFTIATSSLYSGATGQFPYFSGANTITATSSIFLATSGNVGIGTAIPNWNLQIAGTRPSFALSDTSAGDNLKHWLFSSMGGNLYIGTSTDAFGTSTPSALTILNNGNVGIGTSSPTTYKFSVNGSASLGSGDEVMRVSSTGNVGIGTTSPYAKLSLVDNTASLRDVFTISSTTSGLIFKVDSYGRTFADGAYTGTGADYAEYFYTDSVDLQSGEVVCVDIVKNSAVKRCARGADNNVMGIVSTKPSVVGNYIKAVDENPSHYTVIGMMGQVEAFASAENGPIAIGDSLTSASTTPGYAMRADNGDSTVAVALEPLTADTGKIKVLISRRNKSLAVEQVESLVVDRIANMKIEDSVQQLVKEAIDTIALEKLTISGNVFAGAYETAIASSTGFTFNSTVSTSSPQATVMAEIPSSVLTADGKGVDIYKLATYTLSGVQALAEKIDAQEIHLASLETRVTTLEDGTISSESSAFSTTSLASAFEGFGAFIQKGFAQFGTLVADQFVAATNSAGSSSAGTVTILAGNTVAQVNNTYVKPSSKIFVTLTASTTGSWYISDKQNGSFKLMLENAQPADVSFDYFLIQTEGQIATSTPDSIQGSTLDPNPQGQTLNSDTAPPVSATSTPDTVIATSTPILGDTTPPVVMLIGEAAMQITVGGIFTDPGATATDTSTELEASDTDLTSSIVVTGAVDTATAGLYTLTYTATDTAGNVGTVSRVVTIIGSELVESIAPATTTPNGAGSI